MTFQIDIPRYHMIKTKTGDNRNVTKSDFKNVFGEGNYDYLSYHGIACHGVAKRRYKWYTSSSTCKTYIYFCNGDAKTLFKRYLGIAYERYKANPDDAVVIQGLLGRCTGYDDNGQTIVFTHINSIKKYNRLCDSGFDDVSVKLAREDHTNEKKDVIWE